MSFWSDMQNNFSSIVSFLNGLTYKLGVDRTKERDIKSFSFWYKELFHFIGGCIIGLPQIWCIWWFIMFAVLLGYLFSSEEEDVAHGQSELKACLDVVFWSAGFMLPFIMSLVL